MSGRAILEVKIEGVTVLRTDILGLLYTAGYIGGKVSLMPGLRLSASLSDGQKRLAVFDAGRSPSDFPDCEITQ